MEHMSETQQFFLMAFWGLVIVGYAYSRYVKKKKEKLEAERNITFENKIFQVKNEANGSILEVAAFDFRSKMNYYEAKKACEALGDGWRLPTTYEAELMYKELHLKRKGNFKKKEGYFPRYGSYWCEKDSSVSQVFCFEAGYTVLG